MAVVAIVLAAGTYAAVRGLAPVIGPVLRGSGCTASAKHQSVLLDTQQASIAATIAGVAHQQSMPRVAVTIAYATAMQESKLHNLHYGDMDSVGVFQQRPSQGWGPTKQLEDPVYATTKFFRALESIHGYESMPVYQAAQDVQHSADGSAYIQYEKMATTMTAAFTGQRGHAVYCWSASWSSPPSPRQADLRGVTGGLSHTFGTAVAAGRHRPARPLHAGPRRPATARLGGGLLAGHARQQLPAARGAVRRVPVAGHGRQQRLGQRCGRTATRQY